MQGSRAVLQTSWTALNIKFQAERKPDSSLDLLIQSRVSIAHKTSEASNFTQPHTTSCFKAEPEPKQSDIPDKLHHPTELQPKRQYNSAVNHEQVRPPKAKAAGS